LIAPAATPRSPRAARIIGRGLGPKIHRTQSVAGDLSLETYRQATRYITITGNPVSVVPLPLADLDAVMDATVADLDARGTCKDQSWLMVMYPIFLS
jgi:hypothetical protein